MILNIQCKDEKELSQIVVQTLGYSFVAFHRHKMKVAYGVGQPLRFEDLDRSASGKQGSVKVSGRAERQFEVGIFISAGDFFLRWMHRQVAHIERFVSEGADHNALHRDIRVSHYAVAVAEPFGGIKILIQSEFFFSKFQVFYAVERQKEIVTVL